MNTRDLPLIKRLTELQGDMSDDRFARRWLGFSSTTWFLLKQGSYGADPGRMLRRCEAALRKIEDRLISENKLAPMSVIVTTDAMRGGVQAVRECQAHPTNRLVVYLAPTGGGKSTFIRHLVAEYGVRTVAVEATETWGESYFSALVAIAERMIGTEAGEKAAVSPDEFKSKRRAETELFRALRATDRLLLLDEGHYMGPSVINLLKSILNLTRTVVVVTAIPKLWTSMNSFAWIEASQLVRRTFCKIQVNAIPYSDGKAFLTARLPKLSDSAEAAEMIRTALGAANMFGLYDTLERIAAEVREEAGGGKITPELMESAIEAAQAMRG